MAAGPQLTAARVNEAVAALAGSWSEYQALQSRIAAELAGKVAEQATTRHAIFKLEQTLPIADQRARDFKTLVEQHFVSQHGFLEREQARIELAADLATLRSRGTEIPASLQEKRAQAQELTATTRRQQLDSLADGQQQLQALDQELRKAESRTALMALRAPVDGTVQQLAVHTVGGVVTAAQALMVIAP